MWCSVVWCSVVWYSVDWLTSRCISFPLPPEKYKGLGWRVPVSGFFWDPRLVLSQYCSYQSVLFQKYKICPSSPSLMIWSRWQLSGRCLPEPPKMMCSWLSTWEGPKSGNPWTGKHRKSLKTTRNTHFRSIENLSQRFSTVQFSTITGKRTLTD